MAAALYTSPSRWAKPTIAVIPAVARATSSIAAWFWSRNSGRKRRSSGGYPVSVSSGKATRSAPRSRARPMVSITFLAFPGRSPTVGLIWASASRTIRSDRSPAGESLLRFTATILPRRALPRHRDERGPKGCRVGTTSVDEEVGRGVREQPGRAREPELRACAPAGRRTCQAGRPGALRRLRRRHAGRGRGRPRRGGPRGGGHAGVARGAAWGGGAGGGAGPCGPPPPPLSGRRGGPFPF